MNFVAVQCVRRCGPRVAVVALECETFVALQCVRRCGLRIGVQGLRCSAARTPVRATHCVRCIRIPKNFVALPCVRRCGLRAVIVAAECPRTSLLCSAHAAAGCALPSSHPNTAVHTPKWVAYCMCRIRVLQNLVSLQRARRCGPRVAFVAPECRRISLLCRACAAVGCALSCCIRMFTGNVFQVDF